MTMWHLFLKIKQKAVLPVEIRVKIEDCSQEQPLLME